MAGQADLIGALLGAGVPIYDMETFRLREYIQDIADAADGSMHTIRSIEHPDVSLVFTSDYKEDGRGFCTVEADDNDGRRVLFSEGEDGYMIGHYNSVEHYLNERMGNGFYDTEDAEARIEGYAERFGGLDMDPNYLDYLASKAEAEINYQRTLIEEGMEVGGEIEEAPDISVIEGAPETEFEQLAKMIDTSTEEGQLELVRLAVSPGGPVDQMLRDEAMMEAEQPDPEWKMEMAGIDRSLSPEAREFFTVTEEKQPYFDVLKTGFVPFEMREGYPGGDGEPVNPDLVLTKDIVDEVRAKYDPDFGKVAGVDTTTFHTRSGDGIEKNVSVIPLQYGDIKEYVSDADFKEEDVKSVRAIKEYGESMEVQGIPVGMTNLVTFEIRLHDSEEVHRSTLVMDDLGIARGSLAEIAGGEPFLMIGDRPDITKLSDIHIDKLDRTNAENPGHFRVMDGTNEVFREKFVSEVEERVPSFFFHFNADVERYMTPDDKEEVGRRDYLELNQADADRNLAAIKPVANMIELYQENLEARAQTANVHASEIIDSLNLALEERHKEDPDSEKYQELTKRIGGLKEDFVQGYKDYVECRNKFQNYSESVRPIETVYTSFAQRPRAIANEYAALFERPINYTMDGFQPEKDKKLTPEERFENLCSIIKGREDLLPAALDLDFRELTTQYHDVISEAFDAISEIVEAHNDSVTCDSERIHFIGGDLELEGIPDNAAGLYTESGFAIEAGARVTLDTTDVEDREKILSSYCSQADQEYWKAIENGGEGLFSVGEKAQAIRAIAYGEEQPEGTAKSRLDIRSDFLKDEIRLGFEKPSFVDQVAINLNPMADVEKLSRTLETYMKVTKGYHGEVPGTDVLKEETQKAKEAKASREVDLNEKDSISQEEDPLDSDEKDDKDKGDKSGFTGIIRNVTQGAYGKVDPEKKTEISNEKLESLRKEADADTSGRDKDAIYEEKVAELKEKLEVVKSDILHYKAEMEQFGNIPARYVRQHMGYAGAKCEYDSAVSTYEALGGKVGAECFVTSGVGKVEIFLEKLEFFNGSNYIVTKVLDSMRGVDTHDAFKNIYKDQDGHAVNRYSGKLSSRMEKSLDFVKVLTWPVLKLNQFLVEKLGVIDIPDIKVSKSDEVDRDPGEPGSGQGVTKGEESMNTDHIERPQDETERKTDAVESEGRQDKERNVSVPSEDRTEKSERMQESSAMEKEDPVETEERLENDRDDVTNPALEETNSRDESVDTDQPDVSFEKAEDVSREDVEEPQDFREDVSEESLQDVEKSDEGKEEFRDATDSEEKEPEERDPKQDTGHSENKPDLEKSEDKEERSEKNVERPEEESKDKLTEKPEDNEAQKDDVSSDHEDADRPKTDAERMAEEQSVEGPDVEKEEMEPDVSSDNPLDLEASDHRKTDAVLAEEAAPDRLDSAKEEQQDEADKMKETAISEGTPEPFSAQDESREEASPFQDTEKEEEDRDETRDFSRELRDVLSGDDEMDGLMDTLTDMLDGGPPQSEIMDLFSDALAQNAETAFADSSTVGDVLFEAMDLFDGAPVDTLDLILSGMESQGTSPEFINSVEEQIAQNFDALEGPFEDTASGEYQGFEFDSAGAHDMFAGDDFMDDFFRSPESLMEFDDATMDFTPIDAVSSDMEPEAMDAAFDVQSALEAQGVDYEVINDVTGQAFDMASGDFANGIDIGAQDYQSYLMEQSMNRAFELSDMQDLDRIQDVDAYQNDQIDYGAACEDLQGLSDMDAGEAAEGIEAIAALL